MLSSIKTLSVLGVFALSIIGTLSTPTPKTEQFTVTFEDPAVQQAEPINAKLNGLEFDGFLGRGESPIGQLIFYNGKKAGGPTPSGNEIQVTRPDQKYSSVNPQSVAVGCFFSKALGRTLGNVPLDSVGLDDLADALQGLSGTASPATSCTIRVRITSMLSRTRLAELKAARRDYVDCKFTATGLLGQGTGTVQFCDLSKNSWSGTTALNFTIQSIDSPVNTGAGSAISNTLPVIDDFKAIGTLM